MNITVITDRSEADSSPCEEWHNGHSGGSIPHIQWPVARISGTVSSTEYDCQRCGKYLRTEVTKPAHSPSVCSNTLVGV